MNRLVDHNSALFMLVRILQTAVDYSLGCATREADNLSSLVIFLSTKTPSIFYRAKHLVRKLTVDCEYAEWPSVCKAIKSIFILN